MAGTAAIFITLLSIFISCTSATPATGLLTPTNWLPWVAVSRMNTPVAFCPGTVARAHGSSILTWAQVGSAQNAPNTKPTDIKRFMRKLLQKK